jgi:hypothetical protein
MIDDTDVVLLVTYIQNEGRPVKVLVGPTGPWFINGECLSSMKIVVFIDAYQDYRDVNYS